MPGGNATGRISPVMSLGDRLRAVRGMWPMLKRAIVSGQLFRPQCELTQPDPDILCEYNVEIPIADGVVLTANVFRSRKAQEQGVRVPVVMCAHPYNNQLIPALGTTPFGGPPVQYRIIPQVGRPRFSTLTSWEAPDPNFWVQAGYAMGTWCWPPQHANAGWSLDAEARQPQVPGSDEHEWRAGKPGLKDRDYAHDGIAATQKSLGFLRDTEF
jgi:hypothetical protein